MARKPRESKLYFLLGILLIKFLILISPASFLSNMELNALSKNLAKFLK